LKFWKRIATKAIQTKTKIYWFITIHLQSYWI
jgi:hypothetical protein